MAEVWVKVNVAEADNTLGPDGRVTLADAVEASIVPASAPLVAVVFAPVVGVTVTVIAVPTGIPLAVNPTVTGFAVEEGRVMSAEPVGLSGAGVPPTVVIREKDYPEQRDFRSRRTRISNIDSLAGKKYTASNFYPSVATTDDTLKGDIGIPISTGSPYLKQQPDRNKQAAIFRSTLTMANRHRR